MKPILIGLILSFIINTSIAQTIGNCVRHNREAAVADIKKGKPRLLFIGGIAPKYYPDDQHFSKKYKIIFHDFGCLPDKAECIMAYNKIIFNYLDTTYGAGWRKEVRQDIFGLHAR